MYYARTVSPPPCARRRRRAYLPVLLLGVALVQACTDAQNPVEEASRNAPTLDLNAATLAIGDVLPGTDPAEFAEAEEAFGEVEASLRELCPGNIAADRAGLDCHGARAHPIDPV